MRRGLGGRRLPVQVPANHRYQCPEPSEVRLRNLKLLRSGAEVMRLDVTAQRLAFALLCLMVYRVCLSRIYSLVDAVKALSVAVFLETFVESGGSEPLDHPGIVWEGDGDGACLRFA